MRICVSNNWLSVVEAEIFVAGSVNVYRVTFDFDESWDGFAANAIFEVPGSDPIEMLVSNGACEIPWEVMSEAKKKFRVGIYGKKDGVRRPTLWTEYFAVAPGASNGVAARPAPAPDIYEQLLDSITKTGTAKEYAEQAQASATKSEEFAIAANQGADEAGNASADAASFAQECNDIYRRLEDLGRVVGDAVMHVDEARWHTDDRANYTTVMAETADRNAQYAQKACDAAESFVEVTRNNASASGLSAQEALNHANASKQSAESAATEAARAKAEADRASAIAGGEFAAVPYVDQKALEAEQNANRYTDEQLESFSGGSSVSKTGDTMAGDLKFEENKGVVFQVYDQYAVPAVSYNAVKMYTPPVDDTDSTVFKIDADSHVQRVQLNKPLDMQSKKVTNVALPESDNDAVNKAYADTKAPIDHATASTDFGLGNEREYGHLRLSDDVYSSSRADGGIAATPNAVNQAYNLASAAAGVAGAAREMVDYAIDRKSVV